MAALVPTDAPVDGPVHTGWLLKEGHDVRAMLGMGDWKERFFVLFYSEEFGYDLLYYKEEANFENIKSQGAIELEGASVAESKTSPAGFFGFLVTTAKGKKFPIRAKSEGERAKWTEKISSAIATPKAKSAPAMSEAVPSGGAAGGGGGKLKAKGSVAVTDFDLQAVVGKGAFGKVFLVNKREGELMNKPLAMKVLDKKVVSDKGQIAHTMSERDILREVEHPYIVRMHFAFQTERKLYMVTDYYPGGNLFAHVQRARRTGGFEEIRARFYSAELCLALDHLHQNGIVYRDLKLENVLMDMEGHVVLTDFGLSKDKCADPKANALSTFCGTVEYMAPELVKGQKYSNAVDWWAFGILSYEMLCTRTPFFHDKGRKAIFQGIIKADPQYPLTFSKPSQDCIGLLLTKDASSRLGMGPNGAADIRNHPWFAGLNWDLLMKRQVDPPWKPDVKDEMDFKYVPKRLQATEKVRDSEIEDGTGAAEVSQAAKWDFTFVQKSKLND